MMKIMRRHRKVYFAQESPKRNSFVLALIVMMILGVVVFVSFGWRQLKISQTIGDKWRMNFVTVVADGGVGFVSYDPSEKKITELAFGDLSFQSRSVGKYRIAQLYALGKYEDEPGEFVRRKMQGFLRLPILSYVQVEELGRRGLRRALWRHLWRKDAAADKISRLDALNLWSKSFFYDYQVITFDHLLKEGVLTKNEDDQYEVNDKRLQQFVGSRLFDWVVGGEGMTVVIINEAGVEGLGNDIARFFSNVGMDVVSVRSGSSQARTRSLVQTRYKKSENLVSDFVVREIMGMNVEYRYEEDLRDYRADIVVWVGRDMLEMF